MADNAESDRVQVALVELNRQEPPEQHALYQYGDPDADYYDGPEDCGCAVSHPRWCAWNGPCCDSCSHGADEARAECCGTAISSGSVDPS